MHRVDWLVSELNILGGAEMFVRLAAPRLRAMGWDLRLISLARGGQMVEQLRELSVPVVEFDFDQRKVSDIYKLLHTLRKDKPRLLHTHLYHAGIAGRLLGRLAGIPTILVQQQGPELQRSKGRTWLDQHSAGLVDRYVVTCNFVKETLQTREHISPQKITVIPNGIEIEDFTQKPAKPKAFPEIPAVPVVGCVGRLSPEKGHHLLVEALSILHQQGRDFHAVMIGDGASKEELLQTTKRLNLEAQISWVGKQTDIPAWLAHLDLFVLPSHWEGISLALLEAMAAGLPVVATHVGGNPDVIINGETGLLVPPRDPARLAEGIARLIENPSLRQEMGCRGQTRCREHFHIDVISAQLDALYKRMLLKNSDER